MHFVRQIFHDLRLGLKNVIFKKTIRVFFNTLISLRYLTYLSIVRYNACPQL